MSPDDETVLAGTRELVARVSGGRYEVKEELGRGGMSRVFLGVDHFRGRQAAFKVLAEGLHASIEDRERFRREALIAGRLAHPNIVPCDDFILRSEATIAVMRYVPGESLAARLTRQAPMDPAELLRILIPVADALVAVHRQGVVHRDVKPANILLRQGDDHPFLTDFGIATLATSEHSRSEVTRKFGTPEYMSPEQALGAWDADHRSDIYSLGMLAYHLLAGRLPYQGTSPLAQTAQRATLDAPPLRVLAPQVPDRLARVIDRCLRRDPRRRWRTAAALRGALRRAGNPRPGIGRVWELIGRRGAA